jgi:hypothetical protein
MTTELKESHHAHPLVKERIIAKMMEEISNGSIQGYFNTLMFQLALFRQLKEFDKETVDASWAANVHELFKRHGYNFSGTEKQTAAFIRRILNDVDLSDYVVIDPGVKFFLVLDAKRDDESCYIPVYRRLSILQRWRVISDLEAMINNKSFEPCTLAEGLRGILQPASYWMKR